MQRTAEILTHSCNWPTPFWRGGIGCSNHRICRDDMAASSERSIRYCSACDCEAVVSGGWAVWRHGYVGRVTQDIDIALPKASVDEFLQAAAVSGFDVLSQPEGRWPKLCHRETGIEVDVLPEGGRPGTAARPAPTTIPHPAKMGAIRGTLRYSLLPSLIELKLAAGRLRDEADVVELARENRDRIDEFGSTCKRFIPNI